jgi:hypothetical protein
MTKSKKILNFIRQVGQRVLTVPVKNYQDDKRIPQ